MRFRPTLLRVWDLGLLYSGIQRFRRRETLTLSLVQFLAGVQTQPVSGFCQGFFLQSTLYFTEVNFLSSNTFRILIGAPNICKKNLNCNLGTRAIFYYIFFLLKMHKCVNRKMFKFKFLRFGSIFRVKLFGIVKICNFLNVSLEMLNLII